MSLVLRLVITGVTGYSRKVSFKTASMYIILDKSCFSTSKSLPVLPNKASNLQKIKYINSQTDLTPPYNFRLLDRKYKYHGKSITNLNPGDHGDPSPGRASVDLTIPYF